jgi:hypothetical protein
MPEDLKQWAWTELYEDLIVQYFSKLDADYASVLVNQLTFLADCNPLYFWQSQDQYFHQLLQA